VPVDPGLREGVAERPVERLPECLDALDDALGDGLEVRDLTGPDLELRVELVELAGQVPQLRTDADVRAALRQAGRLNQNRVLPAADSAPTRPPADSTSCLTIAKPMPAPPRARSRDFSTR
jgi:hypothetical protein